MKIPGQANLVSITRRLSWFQTNQAIRVQEGYESVARYWLRAMVSTVGEMRLIFDATHIDFRHQLLIVALAFRVRAIPIALTWVRSSRGYSSIWVQLALLTYAHGLLLKTIPVLLVGNCAFESGEV